MWELTNKTALEMKIIRLQHELHSSGIYLHINGNNINGYLYGNVNMVT